MMPVGVLIAGRDCCPAAKAMHGKAAPVGLGQDPGAGRRVRLSWNLVGGWAAGSASLRARAKNPESRIAFPLRDLRARPQDELDQLHRGTAQAERHEVPTVLTFHTHTRVAGRTSDRDCPTKPPSESAQSPSTERRLGRPTTRSRTASPATNPSDRANWRKTVAKRVDRLSQPGEASAWQWQM